MSRAYPRRHGGNISENQRHDYAAGLSPQARGKPMSDLPRPAGRGPIPAGTGETHQNPARGRYGGAYPRRHGGNVDKFCLWVRRSGLSPQARGKLIVQRLSDSSYGPIPAGTGETRAKRRIGPKTGAYPRRHGGNEIKSIQFQSLKGLSPQARGKLS